MLEVQGTEVRGNTGGIYINDAQASVSGGVVADNAAAAGGGIVVAGVAAVVNLTGVVLSGNTAVTHAYAVETDAGSSLSSGVGLGGAIHCMRGLLRLEDVVVANNRAQHLGGGVVLSDCSGSLQNATFANNSVLLPYGALLRASDSAEGAGGGLIYHSTVGSSAAVAATNCRFEDNRALRGAGVAAISEHNSPTCLASVAACVSTAMVLGGGFNLVAPAFASNEATVVGDDLFFVHRQVVDPSFPTTWPQIASGGAKLAFVGALPTSVETTATLQEFSVGVVDWGNNAALPPAGALVYVRATGSNVAVSGSTSASFALPQTASSPAAVNATFSNVIVTAQPGTTVTLLLELQPSSGIGSLTMVVTIDKCDAGTQVAHAPGTSCVECSQGAFNPNATASDTACVDCPAGTYGLVKGATSCRAYVFVPDALFVHLITRLKCLAASHRCDAGDVSSPGASECTTCEAGHFANTTSWTCDKCADGTVAPFPGAEHCFDCPAGSALFLACIVGLLYWFVFTCCCTQARS